MNILKIFVCNVILIAFFFPTLSFSQPEGTTSSLIWEKLVGTWNPDCDGSFGTIAIHPIDPNIIYIGSSHQTKGCGIFKSIDGGQTWESANTGLPKKGRGKYKHYSPIMKITIAPSNPDIIYVGLGSFDSFLWGRVYKSIDGGKTWYNASGKRKFRRYLPQIQNLVLDIAVDDAVKFFLQISLKALFSMVFMVSN